MDQQDRQAIEDLFARLKEVERQGAPRDPEAEGFIRQAEARQPGAPYYMAQTIIMQELALQEAQRRIGELERNTQRQGGGLFSGLFGGDPAPRRGGTVPSVSRGRQFDAGRTQQGTGFLAGAAQTAMGVAGGLMLGNMLAGLFSTDAAAAEPSTEDTANEEPGDEGGDGLLGDSFGDFGGDG